VRGWPCPAMPGLFRIMLSMSSGHCASAITRL
jgi:hypothetical protein